MPSIKFNYATPFSLLKLVQSCFRPPAGEPIWSFGNFFVSFLCLGLLNIFSIYSRDVFDSVECIAWFLFCGYLSLMSIDTSLSILQSFSSPKFSSSLSPWPCIWKFFIMVVFSCLYTSWSIFHTRLKWLIGSWSPRPYFTANIVRNRYDSNSSTLFLKV